MTPALPLVLFVLYAAVLDLGAGIGFVGAVTLPPGWLLLAAGAILLAVRAVSSARAPGPVSLRLARALVAAGAALALLALPATVLRRDVRTLVAGEGLELPPDALPGLPAVRFGEVTLAPTGPHFLSKTVSIAAEEPDAAPVAIGLFPPTALGGWRFSVVRYGFAPHVVLTGPRGGEIDAFVPLGQLSPAPEHAALVAWTPEPNVMMGAGTFPPRLEDLLSPPGTGLHFFLRLEEATLAGVRRDLRDPDAYRWLADERPRDPAFLVQVFRGRERIAEGRVAGGGALPFPGGSLGIRRELGLWVELVAARDRWLPWAGLGLALLAAGALLHAGRGAARAVRALTARAAAAPR